MSEFNIEDLDAVIARSREGSLAQMLALQLKGQIRKSEQLAAENVGLKSAITDHSQSVHFCEVCGKDDPCSTDDVCYVLSEPPATDRIYAGIKAEGAEACVRALVTSDDDDFSDAPNICAMVAYQLRKGEKS